MIRDSAIDPSWAARGLKVTTSNVFTITDSVVDRNRGPAIWIDLQVTGTVVAATPYATICDPV